MDSKKVAYAGILLGLNIIILLLVNIVPINTLFLLGLASLPLSVVIMEFGPKVGVVFYLGSVILGFLVMANKFQWVLYTFTFGVYGMIKYLIDRDRNIFVEYGLTLVAGNILALIAYFFVNQFVFIPINLITIVIF